MNPARLSARAAALALALLSATPAGWAADAAAPGSDLWTGVYFGAQAGYLQGDGEPDICVSVTGLGRDCSGLPSDFGLGGNAEGVTVGGYVGYNHRIDQVVLGIEGDFNWDSASNNGVGDPVDVDNPFGPQSTSLNWDASVRARLGMVFGERAMVYVTGGPSWIEAELDNGYCATIRGETNISCGETSTAFGWQLGAGAEYFITDHLSMKAEYLHGWYGNVDLNVFTIADADGELKYEARQDLQTNVVRAGVAWHFGGF
jgi:outer membrane immunogenic protein